MPLTLRLVLLGPLMAVAACEHHFYTGPEPTAPISPCSPELFTRQGPVKSGMSVVSNGLVADRYTAELAERWPIAYTTTWGGIARKPGVSGNAFYIWDLSIDPPRIVDSVIVGNGVRTLGDVAISPDGKLLVVATEYAPGSI